VRSLVEQHGGSVSAASGGPGQGSEFTIRLPHADWAETVPARTLASHAVGHSARPQRVLLVDDNEDAATMLAETLTLAGHRVRTAHDGPEALRAAAAFRPQVAVVDIGLPVMDGYELARRLKDLPDPPRSLIALSGYGQPLDHERSARAGFFAHLVKPVDFEALRRTVDSSSAEPDSPQREP
jgi:CheY-like chemotaxis protein